MFIRNHQILVKFHLVAKSETLRAGAKGIVKGKTSRFYLINTDAAVRAGKTLGKLDLLSTDHIHGHQSVRQFQYIFNGIHQTFFNAFLYYQTVYYNLDIVLFIFIQTDLLCQFIHTPVNLYTYITTAFDAV